MNPIAVNLVAVCALTGALIDNFSWGVLFSLVACVFLFVVTVTVAQRQRKLAEELEALAEEKLSRAGGQG
jgi:hypothetical protein